MPDIDENELKKQASVEDELKKQATDDELKKQASNPVGWLWTLLFQYRIGKVIILCFALVTAISLFGQGVEKIAAWYDSAGTYFSSTKWPAQPVVLYIYPDGEFGLLRKNGFERGINTENKQAFHIEYFDPPFKLLKIGDISGIKEKLIGMLNTNTVVAVVAPSISEATEPVIKIVREINPNIPIVIESSVDPVEVNWHPERNLFRLSSGVDTRGREIGHVIASLVSSSRPVAIIAEDGTGSYGGKILQYASNVSPLIDSVPKLRYKPGSLDAQLKTLFQNTANFDQVSDEAIKRLRDPKAVVFFLGVGNDMEPLLKLAYTENGSLQAQAKLVGIMNAYKLAQLYASDNTNKFKSDLIFEITDFDFIFPFNPPEEAVKFGQLFSNSKPLSPGLRDQAYSYDEAQLLNEAVKTVSQNAGSYNNGLTQINAYLRSYNGRGVTGNIVLGGGKEGASASSEPVGQNVGSTLRLAVYHRNSDRWIITSTSAL